MQKTLVHLHSQDTHSPSFPLSLDEVRDLELLLHDHPVATSAGVVVRPVLVPHLPAALAAPVLPTLREAGVVVGPDQLRPIKSRFLYFGFTRGVTTCCLYRAEKSTCTWLHEVCCCCSLTALPGPVKLDVLLRAICMFQKPEGCKKT